MEAKRKKRFENKYAKRIDALMAEYKDRTMAELWEAFEELKGEMRREAEARGIILDE